MADVDPNSIPFVPSTEVSLIDTQTGRPKQAMHDWMSKIFDWMKRSVVDLTTKITTLIFQQGELEAAIVEEATIREEDDGVLALQINGVAAAVGDISADGQIYMAAKATPGGATAAYGIYLTAGSKFTGLEMLATSGGQSAIGMTASKFTFTDSGTAQQVLAYNGSAFVFQVPIVIQNASSGARMVITNEAIRVYDASNVLRVAIGVGI